MSRLTRLSVLSIVSVTSLMVACAEGDRDPAATSGSGETAPIVITTAAAVEQPITRFIRVTGTLTAQEDADVAAEIAGRVVATPVERGSAVARGAALIRILSTDVDAQAQEAEANAAQIEARLAIADGAPFDVERVAEVANARAAYELAQTEFERTRMLQEQRLISLSDFDQRRAQTEAARRQYEVARNTAEQQYQALMGARARLAVARKAVADTVVRSPFDGVVSERLVSVGDYVTRGATVASVMSINPLRVELTVPEQYSGAIAQGRAVTLEVDAYPGEAFQGEVRYVSPSVKADSRALVVEAVVANAHGRLKPGGFATARIEQSVKTPGILVPTAAVQKTAGTARVYLDAGGRVEERIVTTGQAVGELLEITSGVSAGDRVAVTGVARLTDGASIRVER